MTVTFEQGYTWKQDDTFLLFRAESHVQRFLEYLNQQHSNIKFTVEKEKEGKLAFLDVLASRNNGVFETSVYRKEIFTGLLM